MRRFQKILAPLLLALLLLVTSCANKPPSRFDQAQQESTQGRQKNQAVSKQAEKGGSFNKFFPASGDDYKRVYSQEKKGFAQAKLKKDGKEVALMSISDTISTPTPKDKFKGSKEKIGGYPAVNQGKKATAVLVGDRYQVKVMSRDPSFTESDRKAWLAKFDLNGLARLK
ncbi:MAG: hypothetical protein F6K10_43485 [Moorea sp. SIO2B7]|nr:hypothetical protein [Moorena sp. SIO2B7]